MRVLFLTTLLPGLRRTGSEVCSRSFSDALRTQGHEVTLLGYRRTGTRPPLAPGDVDVAERRIETDGAGGAAIGWMAHALAAGLPYSQAKFMSRAYARRAAEEIAQRPDAIVLDHARMAWLLPDDGFGIPFGYLAHNVEHRLYEELAAGTSGPRRWANAREARLIRPQEERLCRLSRAVWTLTSDEARALDTLGADGRAEAFALPATVASAPLGDAAPVADVAILGTWTWRANAEGLRWFLDEVAPLLGGDLDVRIGGSQSEELAAAAGVAGVTGVGRVPDALAFLRTARVIAIPSVKGAGVQVKTLDAIATGRRVVSTAVGLRGIPDPPPTVLCADAPEAFAEALRAAAGSAGEAGSSAAAARWTEARRQAFEHQVGRSVQRWVA